MKRELSTILFNKSYHFETLRKYFRDRTPITETTTYSYKETDYVAEVVNFKKLWKQDRFFVHPKHKRLLYVNQDNLEAIIDYLNSKNNRA